MSEIHGAVGSYVIDALDPAELDEFEAHLAVCPTCSQEVVEFCETAAELSLLAGAPGPPPALRTSILSAIAEVRPLPPELPAERPEAARPQVVARVEQVVDELAVRRQQRRTRILTLAVAAVTIVALSMGGWVFSLVQNRQSQVAEATLENQLMTAPDVKVLATRTVNGGQVSFVSSKQLNKALLVTQDLPATDAAHRYQLWTLQGAKLEIATPDNLLDGGTRKQWFRGPVAESSGLAVTIEPSAGSQQPTLPIQAVAQI